MWYRTVFAQLKIPPVVLLVQTQLCHPGLEDIQTILSFGSSDDLSKSGRKYVHGAHCLAVIVELHVEGLDLLWIVSDNHRTLCNLLGEESLMLCLKVASPERLEVELVRSLLKLLDRIGVSHVGERALNHVE